MAPKKTPPPASSAQGSIDDLLRQFGGGGTPTGSGKVYMGQTNVRQVPNSQGHSQESDRSGLGTVTQGADQYMGIDQAKGSIYSWDNTKLQFFQLQAYHSGLYGSYQPTAGVLDMQTQQLWERLVDQAAAYNAVGRKLSPEDVLGMYAGGSAGGQGQTSTSHSTSVHLSDITEAKGILNSVFEDKLGRDVTDSEAKAFLGALNAQQRAHPSTSTTTSSSDAQGNSTSNSSSTDIGFAADQYAKDYARGKYGKEIDTRTIGVDYYQAALQKLGAIA